MTRRLPFVLTACAVLLLSHGSASAQAPRTPWGDPDLQGCVHEQRREPDPDGASGYSQREVAVGHQCSRAREAERTAQRRSRRGGQAALGAAQPAPLVREPQPRRTAAPGSSSIRRTARFRRRPPRRRLARRRVRRREKVAAMRTRTKIAASTIAASPAACPVR